MRIKCLRRRKVWRQPLGQLQSSMEKSARTAGINYELRPKLNAAALPFASDEPRVLGTIQRIEAAFVEVFHVESLGFLHKKQIKVRPVPMRVRNLIVRTGGDEQLLVT